MVPFDILVLVCIAYVVFLFLVAFLVEKRARERAPGWLRSPVIYTLSLSIYCTAWTFYGAVGYAARSGLEFVTIYLGPTLVFVGWWLFLRKLVRVAKSQRATSIADMISSRYGKSPAIGALVTVLCVVAATPYIALQLQSMSLSFAVFAADSSEGWALPDRYATGFWVAVGLALFTILFGTRNLDANEQHHGVVTAIAVEAVVKLVALLAVGIFVVWVVADGAADVVARIRASDVAAWELRPGRWVGLTFVAATAIFCLPRMFQVLVVENSDERHLATAAWAFPLYLFLMSLFVVPIAVVGREALPAVNPDLLVLTLPLSLDRGDLAMLAFLGGFSSATSMVIVAAIALSTMVSNHVVMPLWLSVVRDRRGDVRQLVLRARRASILGVLALGYGYFRVSGGGEALAAMGLIAFVGVAQMLPALIGGLYWRGGTRTGAAAGLAAGFAVWLYALFLPSFGPDVILPAAVLAEGPWGIGWLRPRALFGAEGMDPLLHALFWSLALNTALYCAASIVSFPSPLERVQAQRFVDVFEIAPAASGWSKGGAEAEDLLAMAQRILGPAPAQAFFRAEAEAQGKTGWLPDTTPAFLERLERRLAGSVGAATAHAMIAQIAGGASVSVEDLMAVANETAQIMEYSSQLEQKSEELSRTARALREANEKLTQLSVQKDAFLSQISHELRTPMTSIRAFSEILMDPDGLPDDVRTRYAGIIHEEAIRLTRLLDDLLDLSVLEHGQVQLQESTVVLRDLIDRAILASASTAPERVFVIERDQSREAVAVTTDAGRLTQVLINLLSNARKYCDAAEPRIRIEVRVAGERAELDVIDNGSGIPKQSQALIFEKFARLTDTTRAGGAGLGLAICREIMGKLGGSIVYLPGQGGAAFRLSFPLRLAQAA